MRGLILAKFPFFCGFFFHFVGFPLSVYLVSFKGDWKCKSRNKGLKWECVCVSSERSEKTERCFQLEIS